MILSLDESIQRLKAEILSPDWSLSPKKIESLEAAFTCLKNRLKTRKNAFGILSMADSILQFARKRQEPLPAEFVDFLKEAMAHVVNMYEESKFDPDRDAELFRRVYAKFLQLKEKVKAERSVSGGDSGDEAIFAAAAEEDGAPEPAAAPQAPVPEPPRPSREVAARPATRAMAAAKPFELPPGSLVRRVVIGGVAALVPEDSIALARAISPKKRKGYLKASQIPLKDFGGIFRSLAGQFKGTLGQQRSGKLKQLALPLMVPRGMALPPIPDEEATALLVVSGGQWHGAFLCREVEVEPLQASSFVRSKNGDIAGIARVAADEELPVLSMGPLLEREGFLLMPD
ncbi:MAG: hypothetical protein ACOY3Z_12505 [Thermodesulfobacteriota bacterium]